ncbi:hypothetical protein LOK49_LG12G02592 [Camellia lanceoleosa]|uniref:Uncharacterized protein n=1 Tax=Camellia lanceoleosa TaxID=1840588 RepID=A0ACC0FUL8_9ERIC|nr:hypothetical protein LOK49_LG12G02592 [Camellia lanceoleosa]
MEWGNPISSLGGCPTTNKLLNLLLSAEDSGLEDVHLLECLGSFQCASIHLFICYAAHLLECSGQCCSSVINQVELCSRLDCYWVGFMVRIWFGEGMLTILVQVSYWCLGLLNGGQSWEKTMDCHSPSQGLMPASFKVCTVPLDGDESAMEEVLDPDFGEAAFGRVALVNSGLW